MKNNTTLLLCAFLLLFQNILLAFSPYESFLQSGKPRQVGLLAIVEEEKMASFKETLEAIHTGNCRDHLADAGITNLSAYSREIGGQTWIVLHFTLAGNVDYLDAAQLFESATPGTKALSGLIKSPERAARFQTRWLQMEWINYIRGKEVAHPAKSRLMIVTTILPEKEEEYRTLHQTVWPGVVDQVARSNSRDLCIFLADIDDLLVEFLYVEYVGTDQKADDDMSQTDAINHRWWKLTDACQKGLPGVDGNWTLMEPVIAEDKTDE
ncbi:MAG: L-rhamnose mutarotase [Puniceicoccaceae bacterium]